MMGGNAVFYREIKIFNTIFMPSFLGDGLEIGINKICITTAGYNEKNYNGKNKFTHFFLDIDR